jgi:hypothetical protein
MPGQESNSPAGHLPHRDQVTGRPVRGIDLDLFRTLKKLVKPGAADDGDAGQVRHGGQATFSLEDDEDDPDDDVLTVSPDFFSDSDFPDAVPLEEGLVEEDSLVLVAEPPFSLALAAVAAAVLLRLSVR